MLLFIVFSLVIFFLFFFFFSSRRRHTRYIGDWSSDVCSSDLYASAHIAGAWFAIRARLAQAFANIPLRGTLVLTRSEERRVGKECRSRWCAYQLKKKERREMG